MRKIKFKQTAGLFLTGIIALAQLCIPVKAGNASGNGVKTQPYSAESMAIEPYSYNNARIEYENKSEYEGAPIIIDSVTYIKAEGDKPETKIDYDGRTGVLTWPAGTQSVEWRFTASKNGLYQIELDYYTCNDSSANIQRGIKLDGKILYNELNNFILPREYTDDGAPRVNTAGDEIAPQLKEIHRWNTVRIWDYEGLYDEPLLMYIEKGEHILEMTQAGNQPVVIGEIRLTAPEKLPSYAEKLEEYKKSGYTDASSGYLWQAENALYKSASVLRMSSSAELSCSPRAVGKKVINVIGGANWSKGNQSVAWELDAPESGLYELSFYGYQYYRNGLPSYRQIMIDGEIPFEECRAYPVPADRKWQTHTLSGKDGEPFLFFLTKGKHQLKMTVKSGALDALVHMINADMDILSKMFLRVTMLTGSDPDIILTMSWKTVYRSLSSHCGIFPEA